MYNHRKLYKKSKITNTKLYFFMIKYTYQMSKGGRQL